MDSASEKGALLQGLCPGISCVFSTCVQLFDWMIVKWVLSLWIIWLLPPVWQQVLRLRLQDNNIYIFLFFFTSPTCPISLKLDKNLGQNPWTRKWKKNHKIHPAIWMSRTVWRCASKECKTAAHRAVSRPTGFCLQHAIHVCCHLHFLSFPSSPFTLLNLKTIQNGNTQPEGGGGIAMKCSVSQRDVKRKRVLQTMHRVMSITSHEVHSGLAWRS